MKIKIIILCTVSLAFLVTGYLLGLFSARRVTYKVKELQEDKPGKENFVKIDMEYGPIIIKLFPDKAINTVRNFMNLVNNDFYDGLIFHRVIPGDIIQGGDPDGDGTGGPGYTIKAEFNEIRHTRGIVSMARGYEPDSAGSQFFICLSANPEYNRKFTAFGRVVKGMYILEKIKPGDVMKEVSVTRWEKE